MICSGEVVNSIPKSYYGTIIIPYYKDEESELVTKIVPYYIAVDDPNYRVCKHPKTAPPVKGWNFNASRLLNNTAMYARNHDQIYYQIVNKFVKAPYNAALLLKHLNEDLSTGIGIDSTTYQQTIDHLSTSKHIQMTKRSKKSKFNNPVYSTGSISVVLEASGGHFDIYDRTNNVYLESKITLSVGKPKKINLPKEDKNFISNVVPPGALAYPWYGIYTNCSPLKEIEVHSLHDTIHLCRKDNNNCRRKSLVIDYSSDSPYSWVYDEGIALTYVPV
jgi:hypothetical protein